MKKKKRPFQVQVYLYREGADAEPLFLLLRRRADIGGFWQGVTGSIEEGEGNEAAALREAEEETGIRLASVTKLKYEHTFPVEDKWKHLYDEGVNEIREFAFMGKANTEQVKICDEHEEYRWVKYAEAIQLLKWPGNKAAIEEANSSIAQTTRGEALR